LQISAANYFLAEAFSYPLACLGKCERGTRLSGKPTKIQRLLPRISYVFASNYAVVIMVITVRVSHRLLIPAAYINPVFMIANVADATARWKVVAVVTAVAVIIVIVVVAAAAAAAVAAVAASWRDVPRMVARAILKVGKLKMKQRRAALLFDWTSRRGWEEKSALCGGNDRHA